MIYRSPVAAAVENDDDNDDEEEKTEKNTSINDCCGSGSKMVT